MQDNRNQNCSEEERGGGQGPISTIRVSSDHTDMTEKTKDINGQLSNVVVTCNQEKQKDTEEDWELWNYIETFFAEFFGTGFLMAVGCMGTVTGFTPEGISSLQAGLTFGFIVATLIQIFGHISAAHFNPAVTVCFYVLGQVTSIAQVVCYILAETLGAIAGLALLKVLTPQEQTCLCCTLPGAGMNDFQSLGIEFVITSCLMLLICALTDPRNKDKQDSAPLKFGLLITALSFAGGPYTGASMNPARSLAPAIVNNNWTAQWIYWLAPLVSGFVVPLFYKTLFCKNKNR